MIEPTEEMRGPTIRPLSTTFSAIITTFIFQKSHTCEAYSNTIFAKKVSIMISMIWLGKENPNGMPVHVRTVTV